jgi:hypothetical protein
MPLFFAPFAPVPPGSAATFNPSTVPIYSMRKGARTGTRARQKTAQKVPGIIGGSKRVFAQAPASAADIFETFMAARYRAATTDSRTNGDLSASQLDLFSS